MTFSFENYLAQPSKDIEKLCSLFDINSDFNLFIEDLKKENIDESVIKDFTAAGIYSQFFAQAVLKIKNFYSLESIIKDFYSKSDQGYFLSIETKEISSLQDLKLFLYNIVKKESARIAFRDILGKAAPKETLEDLSMLADSCVKKALNFLHEEQEAVYGTPTDENGSPQQLIAVAMGKLGAMELNFSSDIDLMLVFPQKGETNGDRSISNEEFFIKIARKFISVFKGPIPGDDTYIIDLRLRPFGDSGPLVMSIKALDHYYRTQGREWERYALIKSRCITGYWEHIKKFYKTINPFVFRRYLDYGAFDSMREMKRKIIFEIKLKDNEKNIKNGSGGIREVEFFGQVFQLIRGGIDKRFRQREIITILNLLVSEGFVPEPIIEELKSSYTFLRIAENRIQQLKRTQTHLIPQDQNDVLKVAMSLGFENIEEFLQKTNEIRSFIHTHFMEILKDESDNNENDEFVFFKMLWESPSENENIVLENLNEREIYPQKDLLRIIKSFKNEVKSYRLPSETTERLDRLMPFIIKELMAENIGPDAANRVIGLISAILKKSCYISLLLENPNAVHHLVNLCKKSSWVGGYLRNHPLLLDELLDSRTLYYPPEKQEMASILKSRLSRVDSDNTERILETLCVFKQSITLRIASAEISGKYPLMKISDRLTELAEVITKEVLDLAWKELTARHGYPVDKNKNKLLTPGVAVIAYGKLGGIELGYGSDLDLVFVHNDVEGITSGEKPVSCVNFYAKLARKVFSYLSIHTSVGKMYEIDLRLRPGGNAGVIIVSLSAFANYFASNAWTFEHQAFVKARIICGDDEISQSFSQMRKKLLCAKREKTKLQQEVRSMRNKILQVHKSTNKNIFHLKHDAGAMMDIEFLAEYLILLNAHKKPKITEFTDIVRILSSLEREKILSRTQASLLRFAYLAYRATGHQLDLIEKKPELENKRFEKIRKMVRLIWNKHLE